jgi:hypothetical protein
VPGVISRIGIALVAIAATGCVRYYHPPTAADPHATVKIRRTFEKSAGSRLKETAQVNGHVAQDVVDAAELAGAPRTSAILVHPAPAKLGVGGGFFHLEQHMVTESYTVQVPYTQVESYSCGFGKSTSTCTRTVTHYRSETRWRTVLRTVEVSDGWCASAVRFAPRAGHMYIVDYTYRENGVCSAACLEQTAIMSDGSFQSAPCPTITAAEGRAIADAEADD